MSLRIVSFNVNGVNDPHKRALVLHQLKALSCDVACLQECQAPDAANLHTWLGLYSWVRVITHHLCPILLFNDALELLSVCVSECQLRVCLRLTDSLALDLPDPAQTQLWIRNIYLPVDLTLRARFLRGAGAVHDDGLGLTAFLDNELICGDFNDLADPYLDSSPPYSPTQYVQRRCWRRHLAPALEYNRIVDVYRLLHPFGSAFSRLPPQQYSDTSRGPTRRTRIDTVLARPCLAGLFTQVTYLDSYAENRESHPRFRRPLSDHRLLLFEIRLGQAPGFSTSSDEAWNHGPGTWRLNTVFFTCQREVDIHLAFVQEQVAYFTAQGGFNFSAWSDFKARCRSNLQYLQRRATATLRPGAWERAEAERARMSTFDHNTTLDEVRRSVARLADLDRVALAQSAQAVRRGVPVLESLPGTWLERFKNQRRHAPIQKIRTAAGETVGELGAILTEVADFFQRLTTPPPVDPILREHAGTVLLSALDPDLRVTDTLRSGISVAISREDVEAALKRASSQSDPGLDGLGYAWYKLILPYAGHLIAEALSDLYHHPAFGPDCPRLKGYLLEKGKTPEQRLLLDQKRPLGLEDCDLRLLDLILQTRIQPACDMLIGVEQTAFIKGRSSSRNHTAATLLTELSSLSLASDPVSFLFLDQAKAYDRVLWPWLFRVLAHFRFPDEFIRYYRAKYDHPTTTFYLDGHACPPVKLLSGVLQGGPISPLLFALTFEPCLALLRKNSVGVQLPGLSGPAGLVSTIAFADDATVPLAGSSLRGVLDLTFRLYYRAANAVRSVAKERVATCPRPVPVGEGVTPRPFPDLVECETTDLKVLGVPLSLDPSVLPSGLKDAVQGVQKRLSLWRDTGISLSARVQYLNMFMAKVFHIFAVAPLYPTLFQDIDRICVDFLFRRRAGPLSIRDIQRPVTLGGLGLTDFGALALSLFGATVWVVLGDSQLLAMLRMVLEAEGLSTVFCLCRRGKAFFTRRKLLAAHPFLLRFVDACESLGLELSTDWARYTHREVMAVPLDALRRVIPGWAFIRDEVWYHLRKAGILSFGHVFRYDSRRRKVYFPTRQQRLELPSSSRRAWSGIAHDWDRILDSLPEDLRFRLFHGDDGRRTYDDPTLFSVEDSQCLPRSTLLTLAGMTMEEYKPRRARNWRGLQAKLVTPSWVLPPSHLPHSDTIWGNTFKELKPLKAAPKLFGCWYLLLHRRLPVAQIFHPVFARVPCLSGCGGFSDSVCHGYLVCPAVQHAWILSSDILVIFLPHGQAEIRARIMATLSLLTTSDPDDIAVLELVRAFPSIRTEFSAQGSLVFWWFQVTLQVIRQCRAASLKAWYAAEEGLDARGIIYGFTDVQQRVRLGLMEIGYTPS